MPGLHGDERAAIKCRTKSCATVHPDCRLPTRSSVADATVTCSKQSNVEMHMPNWLPAVVPYGADQTVYLVFDSSGASRKRLPRKRDRAGGPRNDHLRSPNRPVQRSGARHGLQHTRALDRGCFTPSRAKRYRPLSRASAATCVVRPRRSSRLRGESRWISGHQQLERSSRLRLICFAQAFAYWGFPEPTGPVRCVGTLGVASMARRDEAISTFVRR